MQYVFMDNYRGFTEAIIPLADVSFLVGENSTGKSSFLTLLKFFSSSDFQYGPNLMGEGLSSLGGFRDIVSVSSEDRSYFSVGILEINTKARRTTKARQGLLAFTVLRFRDEEGVPRISTYTYCNLEHIITIKFNKDGISFRRGRCAPEETRDDTQIRNFFLEVYRRENKLSDFQKFSEVIPGNYPLPSLIWRINTAYPAQLNEDKVRIEEFAFQRRLAIRNLTWLAPIRTRPRRIYEGYKTDFTPEGHHTPFVIRKALGSKATAKRFTDHLKQFGESSGLFSSVSNHRYGRDPSAPFEVIVKLHGKALNINNVGYGVSQVLPVIVEMITQSQGATLAIQQPEVHLHPRAQAALGDLIHFLTVEQDHRYVIETHSDYLIDRFRLGVKRDGRPRNAQVVFFERTTKGNHAIVLPINEKGQYPQFQPQSFRQFFINEELRLLEI